MIQGSGELLYNDQVQVVGPTDIIHIKKEDKHQMRNTGDVDIIFIEVQRGDYFGEDDIVRLTDDYGRS